MKPPGDQAWSGFIPDTHPPCGSNKYSVTIGTIICPAKAVLCPMTPVSTRSFSL